MRGNNDYKPYRISAAYDSETCNVVNGTKKIAYPILHQLGLIDGDTKDVTPDNVEKRTRVFLYRNAEQLYDALDRMANACLNYVPVVMCHNLSFDMYGLAPYLMRHNVKVLAKSKRKPISFTILDDENKPRLVIWDTLVFSQKSLDYMGKECGYEKLVGAWDYDLIRTPETPLTDDEIAYSKHDIYSLVAWVAYWLKLNPDIKPEWLGLNVVSKTGIVRKRRVVRFSKVKGNSLKRNVGQYWSVLNKANLPHDSEELFTVNAATRGGFTFCARENASRVFDLSGTNKRVYGFDATSQHPSQMVSHKYPVNFKKVGCETLDLAFQNICIQSIDDVLNNYAKPFIVAFYGYFKFKNLRLKDGSLFKEFGIAPLTWARFKTYERNEIVNEDNESGEEFREFANANGWKDTCINPIYSFGKLESADECTICITELTAWEISKAYDFDSCEAISGYATMKFDRPSDMAVISVMQFYAAKNAFKNARERYYSGQKVNEDELRKYHIPEFVIQGMNAHSIEDSVVESTYLGLKSDLNALFGIEASNEYRRDTIMTENGIDYEGDFGICNEPKRPKAFYQFGQRIVGWSRIAQILTMQLIFPHCETIINGDTDSIKAVISNDELTDAMRALKKLERAIDEAKYYICKRVRNAYPTLYNPLPKIGYYVTEFSTAKFCASWNKAYAICDTDKRDGKEHVHFTLAGVPAKKADIMADEMLADGKSFADICNIFLGYNTTYAYDMTGLNARSFPEWATYVDMDITDYRGQKSHVHEPSALCLYPMSKTVNDTRTDDNAVNCGHALNNNATVDTSSKIITHGEIVRIGDI